MAPHWRHLMLFIVALPMFTLMACESDDAKLSRIEQERTISCLLEQAAQARYDATKLDADYDSLGARAVDCENARRAERLFWR